MKTIHDLGIQSSPAWLRPDLYPFKSRYFPFQNGKIHYLDEGEGLPIIFSHPAVGWSFMYRALIRELSPYYRCIAIDYPGFGLSEVPKTYRYTLRAQSEALESLLEYLNLDEAIFLGHDTGGASAFAVSLRRPELVRGFILTDTIIFPVSEYPSIANFLSIINSGLFRRLNRHFNFLVRLTTRFGFKTIKLSKAERNVYLQSFDTIAKREAIIDILFDLRQNEQLLQEIQTGFTKQWSAVPVLLMCGENDKLVKEGIYDRTVQLLTNGTAHLIPEEEHFPHEGQGKLMANHIRDWITKQIVLPRHQSFSKL